MGLTKNKERFLFDRRLNVHQIQDCPIYAGMIEQHDQAVDIELNKLDEAWIRRQYHRLLHFRQWSVSLRVTPMPHPTYR